MSGASGGTLKALWTWNKGIFVGVKNGEVGAAKRAIFDSYEDLTMVNWARYGARTLIPIDWLVKNDEKKVTSCRRSGNKDLHSTLALVTSILDPLVEWFEW
jgi:hypothetical protein